MSTVQDIDIQGISETLCAELREGIANFCKLTSTDQQYLETTVKDTSTHIEKGDEDFDGDAIKSILGYLVLKQLGGVV